MTPSSATQQPTTLPHVVVYTDGACKGNPGRGGWGVVLQSAGGAQTATKTKELHGGEALTTNNRMELTAAIEALKALKTRCQVTLHTDSKYVIQGITEWLPGWRAKGWKTAAKTPVKNADLWQTLDDQARAHQVQWVWVKGHAGNPGNERADALANLGAAG